MRSKFHAFMDHEVSHYVVFVVIVLNAIVLGLETSKDVMSATGNLLPTIELGFIAFFVMEMGVRIYLHPKKFFKSGWDTADLVIVLLSLVPHMRSLSILRLFRVLNRLPHMQQILDSVRKISVQIVVVTLIMCVLFFTFGVIGVRMYGENVPFHFGDLDWSLLTIAQIMVADNYGSIIRDVVHKDVSGWLYFTVITIAFYFVVSNLFIGVIVDAIQSAVTKNEKSFKMRNRDLLIDTLERIQNIEAKLMEKDNESQKD